MKIEGKADDFVVDLVESVMYEIHPKLVEARVTLDILMCRKIKAHGWPCLARIKITSEEDRVLGKADATLYLDAEAWGDLADRPRRALIDHELQHLIVIYGRDVDGDPIPETDGAGRPKLKGRLHDWELGGFQAVAERWGEDAPEIRALRAANEQASQQCFSFTRMMVDEDHNPEPSSRRPRQRRKAGSGGGSGNGEQPATTIGHTAGAMAPLDEIASYPAKPTESGAVRSPA